MTQPPAYRTTGAPARPGSRVLRGLGLAAAAVYVAVCGLVLGVLLDEGDLAGWVAAVLIILGGASITLAWAMVSWRHPSSRGASVAAWLVLLAGSLPLISFSFVLLPALLLAAPAAWAPRRR